MAAVGAIGRAGDEIAHIPAHSAVGGRFRSESGRRGGCRMSFGRKAGGVLAVFFQNGNPLGRCPAAFASQVLRKPEQIK